MTRDHLLGHSSGYNFTRHYNTRTHLQTFPRNSRRPIRTGLEARPASTRGTANPAKCGAIRV